MGCKVLLHNKRDIRKTWEDHAVEGYYVKTSKEHHRCNEIWVKNTRSIQIANAVFFKYKYIMMLEISKTDVIVVAATHLAKVLQEDILANIGKSSTAQLTQPISIS